MAFAQHHRLPTPLLDWTRRSLVASYFAAGEVARDTRFRETGIADDKLGSHLAVWALRAGNDGRNVWSGNMGILQILGAPGATNPNMRAQAGLFAWLVSDRDVSIEEFVARKTVTSRTPWLRRMVLPHAEAPKLLRLLSYEGISAASMFPGADGVVQAMAEPNLWDRRDKGLHE